jgi:hypothetical protein
MVVILSPYKIRWRDRIRWRGFYDDRCAIGYFFLDQPLADRLYSQRDLDYFFRSKRHLTLF